MERVIRKAEALHIAPEGVSALIRSRRTIKPALFDDREIERDIVEEILEDANWAPNHGNTEPWRFQVYHGRGRERLAEILPALYLETTPEEARKPGKTDKLRNNALSSSHIVALFMTRQASGKIPEIEEIEAVACAVQNMQLSAHAFGIGAFWSTGAMIYTDEAKQRFGLKGDDLLLGFLYLGYPKQEGPDGCRQPVADKVEWIGE